MTETRAVHKDDDKPQLSLIDPLFIREVGRALTIPTVSGKYAPHNWRNGIEVSRLLNSTLRHVNDFNDGVDNDVETGVSHLAHAACNLMFALRMMQDRPDLDDRYKSGEQDALEAGYQKYVAELTALKKKVGPYITIGPTASKEQWIKDKPARDKYLASKQY